jgi:SWI/SNF-related matrix-associated actin-dependent regulator 1 of chromatin subfamily A
MPISYRRQGVDALVQILEDNPDEPIVVFSASKQAIGLAAKRLTKLGIGFVSITGDTPGVDRGGIVQSFQSGSVRVFLGTIGAGGEGITLTASSTVIFLDRDWSPAKNAQAEDRLHRIGQLNAVQIIDIMARDTVDLGKDQKLKLKIAWIRKILGDE